jgi:ankyrin repeat protein
MLISRRAYLRIPKPRASQPKKCEKADYRSTTIVHKAAKRSSTEVVEYFLSAGFDLDESRVLREWNPVMEAARGGKEKVFGFLVDRGADIRAQDQDGQSIIIAAAKGGSIEITTTLIDLGMDLQLPQWN